MYENITLLYRKPWVKELYGVFSTTLEGRCLGKSIRKVFSGCTRFGGIQFLLPQNQKNNALVIHTWKMI